MWVGLATQVKTLRLPEDVVETINDFPGSTFTEKFVATARLLGRDREKLQQQLQNMAGKTAKALVPCGSGENHPQEGEHSVHAG